MDDKQQLMQAKTLIQKGKFSQARKLLEAIPDNETAQRWIDKLDEREVAQAIQRGEEPSRWKIIGKMLLVVFVGLLILSLFAVAIANMEESAQDAQDIIDETRRNLEATRAARELRESLGLPDENTDTPPD